MKNLNPEMIRNLSTFKTSNKFYYQDIVFLGGSVKVTLKMSQNFEFRERNKIQFYCGLRKG